MTNRKLIRPEMPKKEDGAGRGVRRKQAPPEQTNAEEFYYLKQMAARTCSAEGGDAMRLRLRRRRVLPLCADLGGERGTGEDGSPAVGAGCWDHGRAGGPEVAGMKGSAEASSVGRCNGGGGKG